MPEVRKRKPSSRGRLPLRVENKLQDHELSANYCATNKVWTVWNVRSGCIKTKCADIAEIKIYLSKWESPAPSSSQTPTSV